MPRGERPLDVGDETLLRFAADLRLLRQKAGSPTYQVLAHRAHYSKATLAEAAGGRRLPSLAVTLAYVRACDGDVAAWQQRWHEAAVELAAEATAGGGESSDERPPYVGLAAFQPADVDRFFGRERVVADLMSRVARQRFVAVFGASGAGKSSLLRAGLLPRWQEQATHQPPVLLTPGPHPLEECAITLAPLVGSLPGTLHAELSGDRRGLHRIVRQATASQPGDADLVLVVDQFEEVFTLCREQAERDRFIDLLLTAASAANSRCRVVLGVRADFYAHCTSHPDLVEALNDAQLTMGPMTTEELRQAITRPAVGSGCAVETGLLTELVTQADGQIGVLPMLSHALLETWRRRRGNTLTLTGFQATGGVAGALAQTAELVFTRLSKRQQQMARNLMLRLTALGEGTEDTKRRISRRELDDDPDLSLVLDRLVDARLVAVGRDTVEISHEALVRAWPRLREWLADDREGLRLHRELTEATDAWESLDRDAGALYRGVRLARAREWSERHRTAVAARERAFLDASIDAKQAEDRLTRRRSRRLRQLVVLLSGLLVLAVGATIYAVDAQRSAARQRNIALSEAIASKATMLRVSDPALAAQLSLIAYRLAPTAEARTSLLAVFPFPYPERLSGHTANVNSVAFNQDGRMIVTTSHDRTARLWDVTNPRRPGPLAVLDKHTTTVNGAAFSPDGRLVATASWDHTAKLWDVTDPQHPVELATLVGHTGNVNTVAFSADGHTAATASSDHTVKLWDVTNPHAPRQLATLAGHTDQVVAVAFQPNGHLLATASFDRTVGLWDLSKPGAPAFLTGHNTPVTWVAFSPDGRKLASTSQTTRTQISTTKVWDPAGRRELDTLAGHTATVRSAAFGPDGRTIATVSEDGSARLWDLSEPGGRHQVRLLDVHGGLVVSVAFSPDGRTLATGSDDDTAVLWKMPSAWPDHIDMAQAARQACEIIENPISQAEWARYLPGVAYRPPCLNGG